jgi:hypothetical protein
VNVSRLLLANKMNPFEEFINYLKGGHLGFFLFHIPLLDLVSVLCLVLSFLWFLDKGFRCFIQAKVDLVGEGLFLMESHLVKTSLFIPCLD